MKETRFIELLNLYVDQQLTAAEASELEAEIVRTPERRRTYQQYCRMQKACTQLFEHERRSAPASLTLARSLAEADRKIVEFPEIAESRRSRLRYAGGLAALAACVALVAVLQRPLGTPGAPSIQSPTVATVQPVAAEAVADEPVSIPAADPRSRPQGAMYYSVFAGQRSDVAPKNQQQAFATPQEEVSFAWMNEVNLQPLRRINPDDLVFQPRNTLESQDANLRTERRQPLQQYYEQAAFQFQK